MSLASAEAADARQKAMVVRANHTSGRVARAAREILARGKANILGVVFNSVRTHNSDYYYYHYKDYYGKNPTN